MADTLIITTQPVEIKAATPGTPLDLRLAIDIGAYDQIDVQIGLLGIVGAVTTVTVDFMTSMQNQVEDMSWDVLTAPTTSRCITAVAISTSGPVPPKFVIASLPAAGFVLFRYLRWRAFITAGTSATISMSAMGRRKSF